MKPNTLLCRAWPIVATVLALSAITCHPQNRFDIDETATSTIQAGSTTTTLDFPDFDNFNIAKNPTLTSQGITLGNLTSVKMVDLSFTVQAPASGQDLTFLTQVNVYVQASGQARILVATRQTFDANNSSQNLTVAGVELVDYFKQDAVTINAEAVVTTSGSQDIVIEADPVLQIEVSAAQPVCSG